MRGRRSGGGAIAMQRENEERVQIEMQGGDEDQGAGDTRWEDDGDAKRWRR